MKRFFKKFIHTMRSTYLCIKYPFLYPRNRFTGLHYNNWKIIEKLKTLRSEGFGKGLDYKSVVKDKKKARRYHFLKWYHDRFLQVVHCIPTYNELDFFKSEAIGWYKSFGLQMCKEIKKALLEDGGKDALRRYRITQIKEKWGRLEWYDNGCTRQVEKIKEKYQYISERTCIECGRCADYMTVGYILPYCEKCVPKNQKTEKYGTEELPFYGWYKIEKNRQ